MCVANFCIALVSLIIIATKFHFYIMQSILNINYYFFSGDICPKIEDILQFTSGVVDL